MNESSQQSFVVKIGRGAPDEAVRHISRTLVRLDDKSQLTGEYHGFEIAAVSVESYVSKRFAEVADNVYVHTRMAPEQLQALLQEQLGCDYKYCSITKAPQMQ